jgi:hypothetical protein
MCQKDVTNDTASSADKPHDVVVNEESAGSRVKNALFPYLPLGKWVRVRADPTSTRLLYQDL